MGFEGNLRAQTQPANSLSIVTYGATANDATDDAVAIQNCINAAQTQGKSVWIPAGTFNVNGQLNSTDITISGAGNTTSIIYHNAAPTVQTNWWATRCTFRDFKIDSNATARNTSYYSICMKGAGWLIERMKFNHGNCLWLQGSNGTIQDSETTNSYADGININNGSAGYNPDVAGDNLTVQRCTVTTTGDDGIAINSQGINYAGKPNMINSKVLFNNVSNVTWANGIRIAGGQNSQVLNNTVTAPIQQNGIKIGSYGATGFKAVNAVVARNTVNGSGTATNVGGIHMTDGASAAVYSNNINNSTHAGFYMANGGGGSMVLHFGDYGTNTITHPGNQGILIDTGVTGSGTIVNTIVQNLNAGQLAFQNNSAATFNPTRSGNNF